MDLPDLCDIGDSIDIFDWDLSKIERDDLTDAISNPIDLYLECTDDEFYTIPDTLQFACGPSLIGQNVHLQISFPSPLLESTLQEHELDFPCVTCEDVFVKDKGLKDHMKDKHDIEKPYKCDDCPFSTKTLKLLNRHIKRCKDKTSHSKKRNRNKTEIDDLLNLDGRENTAINYNFEDLLKKKDDDVEKPIHCDSCSYKTTSERLLYLHKRTKHNTKRAALVCEVCGFTCMQKRTMKSHSKTHDIEALNNNNNTTCDVCNKSFLSVDKLNRHKLTHKAERPYKCTVCSSSFKLQGMLTDHIKTVHLKHKAKSKQTLVTCTWPNCNKEFRDNYNLKVHYQTHTKEELFKCNYCQYKAYYQRALNHHLKKTHNIISA